MFSGALALGFNWRPNLEGEAGWETLLRLLPSLPLSFFLEPSSLIVFFTCSACIVLQSAQKSGRKFNHCILFVWCHDLLWPEIFKLTNLCKYN